MMQMTFAARVSQLQPSAIREILKATSQSDVISFAAGNPSEEAFPLEFIRETTQALLREHPVDALQYSITEGYAPLRDCLAKHLRERCGIGDPRDRLLVTSGAQQVMDLCARVLCNEGDTVLCEDPSFIGALNAFRACGVRLCGIPMTEEGMDLDALERALRQEKNVRLIYTIPNFQNPTGVTMRLSNRKALLRLAEKYGVPILEDNPYGSLRFAGEDLPSIKALDTEGSVIYAGSFSKVLSPGLRVGFCVAPRALADRLVVVKQVSDVHTNSLSQMLAHAFLTQYSFDAHLEKLRELYGRKAKRMMELADEHLSPHIRYHSVEGGLFLWCTLAEGIDMPAFCKNAADKGVAVVPGNSFAVDPSKPCRHFRMNYSTPTPAQMETGIQILAQTARGMAGN